MLLILVIKHFVSPWVFGIDTGQLVLPGNFLGSAECPYQLGIGALVRNYLLEVAGYRCRWMDCSTVSGNIKRQHQSIPKHLVYQRQ